MKTIQKQAKTVEEAVQLALDELKVTRDKVEVDILEEGTRGILGFLSKPAQVKVTLKKSPEERAVEFLEGLIEFFDLDVDIKSSTKGNIVNVEFEGEKIGILIGRHGSTLDALQYITSIVVNRYYDNFSRIILDAENYRKKREKTLERLAKRLASKVKDTKKSVTLEPMQPNERRIIHTALQGDSAIDTKSIGEEPNRRIVISLK